MKILMLILMASFCSFAQEQIYTTFPTQEEVQITCKAEEKIEVKKKESKRIIFCVDSKGTKNGSYWETQIIPDKDLTQIKNTVSYKNDFLGILLVRGQMQNNLAQGHWTFWKYIPEVDDLKFKYHRFEEGNYAHDFRNGLWYEWKFSGLKGWIKKGFVGNYKAGVRDGVWIEYENAEPYIQVTFKRGKEIKREKIGFDQTDIENIED